MLWKWITPSLLMSLQHVKVLHTICVTVWDILVLTRIQCQHHRLCKDMNVELCIIRADWQHKCQSVSLTSATS